MQSNWTINKEIFNKFSNITLTKKDSNRIKIENAKANHSLDTGVKNEHSNSIYKPNFSKLKKSSTFRMKYYHPLIVYYRISDQLKDNIAQMNNYQSESFKETINRNIQESKQLNGFYSKLMVNLSANRIEQEQTTQ